MKNKPLQVQQYLENHTFDQLSEEHGIFARVTNNSNNRKFSLNYDQVLSVDSDPLTHECRGLVLLTESPVFNNQQVVGKTTILARPFKRFFNHGQASAAKIDWSNNVKVYDKLDGTLAIVYCDQNESWYVATRSVAEANIERYPGETFRGLFEKCLKTTANISFQDFTNQLSPLYTWMFEMTSPTNQIVVPYEKHKLWFLGAVMTQNGRELNPAEVSLPVPVAPSYPLSTLEDIGAFVAAMSPKQHEGVVVCDSDFNRVKIKNPEYLALSHVVGSYAASPRKQLELVLSGKMDDFESFVPKTIYEQLLEYQNKFVVWHTKVTHQFKDLYDVDRKTFALKVQSVCSREMSVMMFLWKNPGKTAEDWVKESNWTSDSFLDKMLEALK